jgi:hypothetical protein
MTAVVGASHALGRLVRVPLLCSRPKQSPSVSSLTPELEDITRGYRFNEMPRRREMKTNRLLLRLMAEN